MFDGDSSVLASSFVRSIGWVCDDHFLHMSFF